VYIVIKIIKYKKFKFSYEIIFDTAPCKLHVINIALIVFKPFAKMLVAMVPGGSIASIASFLCH